MAPLRLLSKTCIFSNKIYIPHAKPWLPKVTSKVPPVFYISKSMSFLKCSFRLHQTTFFTPRRSHSLKIALQKTLSFSTFALQTSTLYCNLHIKLDVKFCAQARLFLKVAKPSEASLPNCVFTTFRPFKNAVRYDNSGFRACAFSWKLKKPSPRLHETHGFENDGNRWFTIVNYICKWQSGHFAYTKCMVLHVPHTSRSSKTL